ncbi:MAG: hypothetical protein LBG80_15560 [Bacteroidales bacterium]|jgi:hypothetical protein|nr:hypothetical protein [Bacteroidales bacterium]
MQKKLKTPVTGKLIRESFIIKYSIPLILIPTIWVSYFPGKIVAVTLVCLTPLIAMAAIFKYPTQNIDGKKILNLFVIYNAIMFVRGIFIAENQSDWIALYNFIFMFFLFPYYIYKLINPKNFMIMIRSYIIWGTVAAFIILGQGKTDGHVSFGATLSGFILLLFFIPYISSKWKIALIVILLGWSFFSDIQYRMNLLNIGVAFLMFLLSYLRSNKLKVKLVKRATVFCFVFPVLFFILGVSGIFNIFKISENMEYVVSQGNKEQNITVDSRTGIYEDVLFGLRDNNAYVFGLGVNGKVKTSLSEHIYSLKSGRSFTESGMFNYLQWGGFVGFLVYFLFFAGASYFAVNKSNNWYMKSLGLWVSFKALCSFLEDQPSSFIYYFFIIYAVGLCYNRDFCRMTNMEMKKYINHLLQFKK